MTDNKTPAPRKRAPATKRAVNRPAIADSDDAGSPPLEAVNTPTPPKRRTPNNRRRGATAPPGPDELVKLRERQRLAVELAASGVQDWDEIARLTGYADRSAAWKAVHTVLDRHEFAAVADYRRLIGYRYERILRANWEAVISQGESVAKDKATPRVFKALEGLRRAFGVDLEVDKLADAFRIPDTEEERTAELILLRDRVRTMRDGTGS